MAKIYFLPIPGGGVVTLRPNYAGIGQMLRYKEFWPPLEQVALRIQALAVTAAPVARVGPHRGRYKASFTTVTGQRAAPHPRVFARVQNTAPEAIQVEYGTYRSRRKGPPHRTLRNAAAGVKGLKI